MAISFIAAGTAGTAGSGDVTPGAPASILAGDILILCGHSRDNVAWSVDNGYTNIVTGNADSLNRLEVWWKRTTGVETTTTVTHTAGNSISVRVYAYRGCKTNGVPWDVAGAVQANAGSPISTAAITTLLNDSMILHLMGSQDNNNWGTFTGACTNDRGGATDTSGSDDSMYLSDGLLPIHGSSGTSAGTQSQFGPDAGASVQIALSPEGYFQMENYKHFEAPSGISVGEKIR
jgi:hypothetical protein